MFEICDFKELKALLESACNGLPHIVDNVNDEEHLLSMYQIVFLDDRLNYFDENDWYNHIKDYEYRTGLEYDGDEVDGRFDSRIIIKSLLDENMLLIRELIVGKGHEDTYYDILNFVNDYAKKKGYAGVRMDLKDKNDAAYEIAEDCGYAYKDLSVNEMISNTLRTGTMKKNLSYITVNKKS